MSRAEKYLKDQGVTTDFAKRHGFSWDEEYLNIPIRDKDGNYLFTKSRYLKYGETKDDKPKYKNSAGSHISLFNIENAKDSDDIVFCEGEMDAFKLWQCGIPSVSSTNGAGSFLPEWQKFFEDKRVWICFDNDGAGQTGVSKVLEEIPHAKVIMLPETYKDVCNYFRENTKDDFIRLKEESLSRDDWFLQDSPEDYSLISLKEIAEMEFDEDSWLVDRIMYSEGFCFIYGASGTGKSYLTLSIAKAVANGEAWLGKFDVPNPTGVLIIDKENPLSLVNKRIVGLDMTNIENIHYLKHPNKFEFSNGKGELSDFASTLSILVKKENIGLIIFDSFVDFVVGNESSSGDTQQFFNVVRKLFPNVALLVLHHENKPSQGVYRNDAQRLRGSSNINAQAFTTFRLEQVARSKTELTLKQTKARDDLKADKFMLRMIVDKLGGSKHIVKRFEYVGDIEDTEADTKFETVTGLILDLIGEKKHVARKEIAEKCEELKISEKTIKRGLKDLLDTVQISSYKKGRETWYTLSMFHDDQIDEIIEELNSDLIAED